MLAPAIQAELVQLARLGIGLLVLIGVLVWLVDRDYRKWRKGLDHGKR